MGDQLELRGEFDPRTAFYTGPGTLAGLYLRSFWQPVYASKQLKPGSAGPIKVLGEEFTLYRGENGRGLSFGSPHVRASWIVDDCSASQWNPNHALHLATRRSMEGLPPGARPSIARPSIGSGEV